MDEVKVGDSQVTDSVVPVKAYKMLKVLIHVFSYHVPNLADNPTALVTSSRKLTNDTISLLVSALDGLLALVFLDSLAGYRAVLFPLVLSLILSNY